MSSIQQLFFNHCAFYVHIGLITNLNTVNDTAARNVTTVPRFPVAGPRCIDLCAHEHMTFIDKGNVFIYRTNHILFHSGLQLFLCGLRSDVSMSRRLWLLLSVHFDITQTPNPRDEIQGYGEHARIVCYLIDAPQRLSTLMSCGTGPTVLIPCHRRLKSLIILRCKILQKQDFLFSYFKTPSNRKKYSWSRINGFFSAEKTGKSERDHFP